MVLTYRSTTPETRVIIERESDGRQRVARATKAADSFRQWDLRVEHPSGQVRTGIFRGDGAEVNLALAQMLSDSEAEWRQEKARGDRPAPGQRDLNAPVRTTGEMGMAPVRTYRR
jgi:hypothetical protein